ncbi:MAG: MASE1 domain-containing protein, partial [Cyclobacteriaceae bacterium]|nr:MASE1 domain-containing protein [Cyclobacteriaceae bacterium]
MNNWINSIFTGNNGIYLRNIEFFKRIIVRKKTLNKLVGINDLRIVVVSISYLLASQLAYWMIFPNTGNYPIWPPSGVSLALVILLGYRVWPGILIGSLITYTIVFITHDIVINTNGVFAIFGISIANVTEALIGYILYNLFIKGDNTVYKKTSNTFKFLAITLVIALIGSTVYTFFLYSFQPSLQAPRVESFLFNYLAEITGLWLFANLILSLVKGRTHWKITRISIAETIFYTSAIAFILYLMNRQNLSIALERSFPILIIPFLLWVAFRSSIQVVTTVVLAISLFSISITIHASGPFVLDNPLSSQLLLQLFIIVIAVTTVLLSASVYERTDARNKLEGFNENLEAAVAKRTKELDKEIKIRLETEKEIRLTNDELRKTNEELDNFVYKVSHDLRAPICSILGLVNIAKKDRGKENMLECVNQIEKSANTQDNFIKDIIELTKNARIKPKRQKIDFEKIVNDTFDYLKYSMNSIPAKPKLHLQQKKAFYSDTNRMKVIFNNIISNSIKYSDPKNTKIDIHIEVENGHAKIDIGDNGAGIDKKYQDDVFKMFFRATDKNAGSGLGLYIVKETVQKLKGNVSLVSEPNKGTTLKMKLPNMEPEKLA